MLPGARPRLLPLLALVAGARAAGGDAGLALHAAQVAEEGARARAIALHASADVAAEPARRAPPREPDLAKGACPQRHAEAARLRDAYGRRITRTHTLQNTGLLWRALGLLLECECDVLGLFAGAGPGAGMEMTQEGLRTYLDTLDLIATTYDDLGQAPEALRYFRRLLDYDRCRVVQRSAAVLEYEYCSGRYYSRSILLLRHSLGREDLAAKVFQEATAKTFGERRERVHWWENEWQVPTLYRRGLRSQPFWEGLDFAAALEGAFHDIREEFLAALAHPTHSLAFTQNDHSLISSGSWGELKLFDGKEWKQPCRDVTPRTCALLQQRPELVGSFPAEHTHHVRLPKEASYFRLTPGARLKPHTGPVNFHLYCHLGLDVPEGPQLRVGGETRLWEEGRALCFDDSFDHEAWHDGSEPRYVLMVTFWHPDLGEPGPAGPVVGPRGP